MQKVGIFSLYDRSGSMSNKQAEAINGMNVYFKNLPEHYSITVAAFDSNNPFQLIRNHVKVRDFNDIDLKEDDISARGGTPLYDSVGSLLDMVDKELDYFSKVVIVIQTDGEENNSLKFNRQTIQTRLDRYNKEKVAVLFLGSEFNNVGMVSESLGVSHNNTINRQKGMYGVTARGLAEATVGYSLCSGEAASSMNWSKEVSNHINKVSK